jgi:hypothetical protein
MQLQRLHLLQLQSTLMQAMLLQQQHPRGQVAVGHPAVDSSLQGVAAAAGAAAAAENVAGTGQATTEAAALDGRCLPEDPQVCCMYAAGWPSCIDTTLAWD